VAGRSRVSFAARTAAVLSHLTVLLVCQLAGEVAVTAFALPIPGPVVGMALLFVALVVRGGGGAAFDGFARGLLQHLGLLFVPAGVGVVLHLDLLAEAWLPIAGALLLGTAITMAVTGWLMQRLARPSPDAVSGSGPEAGR
jgi:holin-like protein